MNAEEASIGDLLHFNNGRGYQGGGGGTVPMFSGKYPLYGSGGKIGTVNSFIYDKESILVPNRGTITNVMYQTEPFWAISTLFWTTAKTSSVDLRYLYYKLQSLDFNEFTQGGTVPSLDLGKLQKVKVKLPPLGEQKQIGLFFSLIDEKISLIKKEKARSIEYSRGLSSMLFSR